MTDTNPKEPRPSMRTATTDMAYLRVRIPPADRAKLQAKADEERRSLASQAAFYLSLILNGKVKVDG
jgi:hypothetical protein